MVQMGLLDQFHAVDLMALGMEGGDEEGDEEGLPFRTV
jgi:hypothetical protein